MLSFLPTDYFRVAIVNFVCVVSRLMALWVGFFSIPCILDNELKFREGFTLQSFRVVGVVDMCVCHNYLPPSTLDACYESARHAVC